MKLRIRRDLCEGDCAFRVLMGAAPLKLGLFGLAAAVGEPSASLWARPH